MLLRIQGYNKETKTKEVDITSEFTITEVDKLKRFAKVANELSNTGFVQNKTIPKIKILYDLSEIKDFSEPINTDIADAFIFRMRKFMLKKEYTKYSKIYKIIKDKFGDNDLMNETLKLCNYYYDGSYYRSEVIIGFDDIIISSDKTLKLWLNYENHQNNESIIREFESLENTFPSKALKNILFNLLIHKALAILTLYNIVCNLTDENGNKIIGGL